ncbi:hypothetical protein [Streptomyces sp. NPDC007100]|uniref:hypothetical protein n=1 Tax=Streptomyces sp. NPDC007100 TaxID=3155602 RepID=UPI00340DED1F
MTYGRLSPEVPLGPFANAPVEVWSTPGKAAKLHASEHCSRARTGRMAASELPLGEAVRRMCPRCAEHGQWARPGTGAGIFLEALTGLGLLYELERYAGADEDTRSDDEVRQAAALLNRLPRGEHENQGEPQEPGGSEELGGSEKSDGSEELAEDEDDWHEVQEAHSERALIFGQWRDAAASLHRAHQLWAPFPWLRPWADAGLRQKAAYVALLQRQAGQLVSRDALVVAACAGAMEAPDLPVEDPALAALGASATVRSELASLWRRWNGRAASSWEHPREHRYVAHHLTDGMSGRRKGRDAVLGCAYQLVSTWTAAAEVAAVGEYGERTLIARLPERRPERRPGHDESFLHDLSEWELAVLASWGMDADWERLTVTLRVPEPVAVRLTSSGSALPCSLPEDVVAEPVAAPAQSVEPGVFDDGPIAQRRPVTAGHLQALRTVSRDADQLYLVLSAVNGPEVMSLSELERRVSSGERYVIVTAAGGLPEEVLPQWHEQVEATDSPEPGSVWPSRSSDPEHPDFGRSLGITEGEQVVARLSSLGGRSRGADVALRSLVLARGVTDLRVLEGTYDEIGYRRNVFPNDVWHGLLAMEQLHLAPFRTVPEDGSRGGSGLPLGVLARVQLYTTDAAGKFQGRAHSPDCAHQRDERGLTRGYDLVTVEEMLHAERFDPCSKCGGYATRRLTEAQIAYYRAAHRVHECARKVRWALGNRELAGDCASLVAKVKEWSDRKPADEWFEAGSQIVRWHHAVGELYRQARELVE